MQNNIPSPNPFIREWLKGPECKAIVGRQGNRALEIYRDIVAKRTGELAGSATVDTHIGGKRNDRWVSTLTVRAPYAASHEFGTDDGDEHIAAGAHDLNVVLNALAGF